MARIAYVMLCHKDPEGVIALVRGLVAGGDSVAIHYDANAPRDGYARLRAAFDDEPSVAFAAKRHRCGWGEWSLVAATLEAAKAARTAFPEATHFYLFSGDCMPIKSGAFARARLDADDADHIESVDFLESDWIRTGMKEERLTYRHFFNERKRKPLFYASLAVQRRLGLTRAIPSDLRIMIGSQWWCLRRATLDAVFAFCAERPDVLRFFRTTWIPDEIFFQTLVRHLVPAPEIRSRTPTFLLFTDYGVPATFYNDHYDLLLSQDALFARKISFEATELRARLIALYSDAGATFSISDEGRRLHRFLTQQGREGRRFAPRFWEPEATLSRGRELLVVVCKKWHVAKRLAEAIRVRGLLPALDYLFDEDAGDVPDLGGAARTLERRHRHRRALVHLLFEHKQTDRLIFCLDPARLDTLRDFEAARASLRVLEIRCEMDTAYLEGHAMRTGLAGPGTPASVLARLIPAVAADIRAESDALADAGLSAFHRVDETADGQANALALAAFLGIPAAEAVSLLGDGSLFAD